MRDLCLQKCDKQQLHVSCQVSCNTIGIDLVFEIDVYCRCEFQGLSAMKQEEGYILNSLNLLGENEDFFSLNLNC